MPLGPGDAERVHSVHNSIILNADKKMRGTFMIRLLSLVDLPRSPIVYLYRSAAHAEQEPTAVPLGYKANNHPVPS